MYSKVISATITNYRFPHYIKGLRRGMAPAYQNKAVSSVLVGSSPGSSGPGSSLPLARPVARAMLPGAAGPTGAGGTTSAQGNGSPGFHDGFLLSLRCPSGCLRLPARLLQTHHFHFVSNVLFPVPRAAQGRTVKNNNRNNATLQRGVKTHVALCILIAPAVDHFYCCFSPGWQSAPATRGWSGARGCAGDGTGFQGWPWVLGCLWTSAL